MDVASLSISKASRLSNDVDALIEISNEVISTCLRYTTSADDSARTLFDEMKSLRNVLESLEESLRGDKIIYPDIKSQLGSLTDLCDSKYGPIIKEVKYLEERLRLPERERLGGSDKICPFWPLKEDETRLKNIETLRKTLERALTGEQVLTDIPNSPWPSKQLAATLEPSSGLRLLYDGTIERENEAGEGDIDIVAVHGVNGHYLKSFTDSTGCCWLRQLLPEDFPRCRVFSYDYGADMFPKVAMRTMSDLSSDFCEDLLSRAGRGEKSRPLVFIGHNLGGLLIKRLLVIANTTRRLKSIMDNTIGILFFGTPHRGTSKASWDLATGKLLGVFTRGKFRTNKTLLHELEITSAQVQSIQADFLRLLSPLLIFTFYEELATKSVGIVVERSSTILSVPNEKAISLHATHRDLCRYSDSASENYRIVKGALMELCEYASLICIYDERPAPPIPRYSDTFLNWMPNIVSKIGKTALGLLEMGGSMENPKDFSHADIDIVAIHGLGGSPVRSWINNTANTLWLRDFLQTDFPTARIISYGYNVEPALRNNTLDLSLLASDLLDNVMNARSVLPQENLRPIAFIGYSFGGLILKKALLLLNETVKSPAHQALFSNLALNVFLGVPHENEESEIISRWTEIVQCTAGVKNFDNLNIGPTMEHICQITTEFRHFKNLYATSIAESEPTKTLGLRAKIILVPAQSVRLGWGNRETVFVARNRNHLQLPTFIDSEDPTYVHIRDTFNNLFSRLGLGREIEESQACLLALQSAHVDNSRKFELIPDSEPGSCEWILELDQMKCWLRDPRGRLVIEGKPGSGKSVLAKYLVRQLPEAFGRETSIVLSHFFSLKSEKQDSGLLASLICQFCRIDPSLIRYAIDEFRLMGGDFADSSQVLWRIFSSIVEAQSSQHIIIILDGLDECYRTSNLLQLLDQIMGLRSLRLIMTNRREPELFHHQNKEGTAFIMIPKASDNDLKLFVSQELDEIEGLIPPSKRQAIEDHIVQKSNGMYLWARLAINEMRRATLPGEMLSDDFISLLPTSLSGLYDQILKRSQRMNSNRDWNTLIEVLSLLLVIVKPITVESIVEALNINLNIKDGMRDAELSSEARTVDYVQHQIIKPLSIFIRESSGDLKLHFSVEEYLRSENSILLTNKPMSFLTEGHLQMAKKSIAKIEIVLHSDSDITDLIECYQGTFTEYAVVNWMHHFFKSQQLAEPPLKTSVYTLFAASGGSSPLRKWLLLYEKFTKKSLPRHKIFGPLFGATYFGLRPIVEMALELGADIEAQDEGGRTALHWAAKHGHVEILELLLIRATDLDIQTYSGWTSLHFAAQHGNVEIVKTLLANGAKVNLEAADGRRPLHVAAEAGRVEVVKELLNAGADVTQSSYADVTIVQPALATDEMMKILMESSIATNGLLRRSLFENNFDMLSFLFQGRPEIITQEYPWVGELLNEEGMNKEEVLDLLLKSENLNWVLSEELKVRNKESWNQISMPEHRRYCAHHIELFEIEQNGNLVQTKSQSENSDKLPSSAREDVPSHSKNEHIHSLDSSETDSIQSVPDFLDPEKRLDDLERREQELINFVGIGGVFPPKEYINPPKLNPGYAVMHQHVAQIVYGNQPTGFSMFIDTTKNIPALQYNFTNQAKVNYDGISNFSINTDFSLESDNSYNSETYDDNFEIWDQGNAQKILEALENVLGGIKYLNTDGECCDRYTLLVKSSRRNRVIEQKTITASALRELCYSLEEFCDASDSKLSGWTGRLAAECRVFFNDMGYGELASDFFTQSLGSGKTTSPSRCLHLCALAAQIASISLVTYSRGHSREFYCPSLTRPIEFFILEGLEDYGPSFCAERIDLACMGDMLKRKAWIFHHDKKALGSFKETFLLSTNIENLLDTWGGWISLPIGHETSDTCVHIGGGSIISAIHAEKNKDIVIDDDEVYCHWVSEVENPFFEQRLISKNAQLVIGATSVNSTCSLTTATCHSSIAQSLSSLGTRPLSWKTTGRTATIGGGKWINLNFSRTQTKDDGRNLKQVLIDSYQASQDLRQLNSPWGLELSLCTGIARRVLLRHLIYGEVLEYLELGLPGKWSLIADIAPKVSNMSDADFETMLKSLTKKQSKVFKEATELLLIAMESTGVGDDGHSLTLWWPEKSQPVPRGIKVLKAQYSGKNPWIAMIKDSEHCAVFGLATTRCLPHDDVKTCRHTDLLPHIWSPVQNIMLDTTLTPVESESTSLPYSQDSRYLLWKRTDILQVTRPRQDAQGVAPEVVQLTYSPGKLRPHIVVNKLKLMGKLEKVKEKGGWGDPGQGVLIL